MLTKYKLHSNIYYDIKMFQLKNNSKLTVPTRAEISQNILC